MNNNCEILSDVNRLVLGEEYLYLFGNDLWKCIFEKTDIKMNGGIPTIYYIFKFTDIPYNNSGYREFEKEEAELFIKINIKNKINYLINK